MKLLLFFSIACNLVKTYGFLNASGTALDDNVTPWEPRQYPSPDHYARAVESVLAGTAPGLYVKYDWDTSKSLSADIEVQHVWTTIPSGSDSNGNGVFASSQFWYHDKDGGTTAGGYLGSQAFRARNGTGFYEKRVFIFSCWDVKNAKLGNATVGWTTPETCQRFGGEGVGSHCILEYDTKPGGLYRFRLAFSGKNETGAFWTGTITAGDTGQSTTVGTLFYPHLKGEIGFGNLGTYSNEFLEYFLGGDCDSDVHTGVGSFGPFFMAGKIEPTAAFPQYGNSACKRSVVHGCIPGYGCGKPRVWVQGGRGVVRNNTDATPLWGNTRDDDE